MQRNNGTLIEQYALDDRTELPSELQFLLNKYPHAVWKGHPNMSGLLRFWVSKHNEFNQGCADLCAKGQAFFEGKITPQIFQQSLVPNISWLLSEFAEHHHIEDHFTFPALRCAEPKLAHGFDILDADHLRINSQLQGLTQVSNQLLQCQKAEELPQLGEGFVTQVKQLAKNLKQHLIDEEEIVIPLFLDRGEQVLHGG